MKKIFVLAILLVPFTTCKKAPADLLVQRWDFAALDMPGIIKFLTQIAETGDSDNITMQKFFLGNKLVLRKDSSFDLVLMKHYIHGTWTFDKNANELYFSDESSNKFNISMHADTINPSYLHLSTDEFTIDRFAHQHEDNRLSYLLRKPYYQFWLQPDRDRYTDLSEDVYSKENNWWRIKPAKPETDEQIKKRVLNHLSFLQLLFHDADEKGRPYVSYNWFSTPFIIASNGIQLQFYRDVKREWDQNFYDSTEAHKGYELMLKCFSKKIKFMQTENKYRRNEDVIKQLTDNLITATKK